jgi:hypothetical protein
MSPQKMAGNICGSLERKKFGCQVSTIDSIVDQFYKHNEGGLETEWLKPNQATSQ